MRDTLLSIIGTIALLVTLGCAEKSSHEGHDHSVVAGKYFAGEGESTHRWKTSALLGKRKIVLTYDDHPGPQTKKLLDVLKKYKVRATFFYNTKNLKVRSKVITKMINEGHILGSHNHVHTNTARVTRGNFKANLEESIRLIEKAYTNPKVKKSIRAQEEKRGIYFRYPYGATASTSENRKMPSSFDSYEVLQDAGYELYDENCVNYAFWDIDTLDWTLRDGQSIFENVVAQLEGGNGYQWKYDEHIQRKRIFHKEYTNPLKGGMILMHDKGKDYAVDATIKIIKWARTNDYEIVPLSEIDGFSFYDRECKYNGR